jgi:hypothetical protein
MTIQVEDQQQPEIRGEERRQGDPWEPRRVPRAFRGAAGR